MKKIIILLSVLVLLGGTAIAQQSGTSKYVITEKGVDVLTKGKKPMLNPPAGSVYDKAVKGETFDDGLTEYKLFKKGKHIGSVYLDDYGTEFIDIWADNVALDNGVKIGDKIKDALAQDKVSAGAYLNMMDGDYEVFFTHGNVTVNATFEFSPSGKKRIEELDNATNQWLENMEGDQPSITITTKDLNEGGVITSFRIFLN